MSRFTRVCARLFVVALSIGLGSGWTESTPGTPDISATGGVSAREIKLSYGLDFWFAIQNKTAIALSTVNLVRGPQGYDIESICVQDSKRNGPCRNKDQFEKDGYRVADSIPPNQSLTVWGVLKSQKTHKSQTLSLVLQWFSTPADNMPTANPGKATRRRPTPAVPAAASTMVVVLGDNAVPSWWDANSAWVYGPLLAAFLGLVTNVVLKWREERQQKAAQKEASTQASRDKQEQTLKDQKEKERDARAETLRLLLPVSHKYAALYYLPLSRAAERAAKTFHEAGQELNRSPRNLLMYHSAARRAFFYLLLVKRIMDEIRNRVGGLYFKDLRGEQLAAQCIRRFEKLMGPEAEALPLALQRIATSLQRTETYESFTQQFWTMPNYTIANPDNKDVWKSFEQWLQQSKNRKEGIEYLAALTVLLDYESNRPYRYWYDVRDTLQLSFRLTENDSISVLPVLLGIAESINFSDAQVREYVVSSEEE